MGGVLANSMGLTNGRQATPKATAADQVFLTHISSSSAVLHSATSLTHCPRLPMPLGPFLKLTIRGEASHDDDNDDDVR